MIIKMKVIGLKQSVVLPIFKVIQWWDKYFSLGRRRPGLPVVIFHPTIGQILEYVCVCSCLHALYQIPDLGKIRRGNCGVVQVRLCGGFNCHLNIYRSSSMLKLSQCHFACRNARYFIRMQDM